MYLGAIPKLYCDGEFLFASTCNVPLLLDIIDMPTRTENRSVDLKVLYMCCMCTKLLTPLVLLTVYLSVLLLLQ